MTILTQEFLRNKLDFAIKTINPVALFNEYYYAICEYVYENSVCKFSPEQIEQMIANGTCGKFKTLIGSREDRENLFKRAMGLQLIYDSNNGRNSMIKGTDGADDICRETKKCLKMLGLLPKIEPIGVAL